MAAGISQSYPSISVAAKRLQDRYKTVFEGLSTTKSINEETADPQKIVPGTPFNSIDIGTRIAMVAEACRTLTSGKSAKLTLYPKNALNKINSSCEQILSRLNLIIDFFKNVNNDRVHNIDIDQYIYSTASGMSHNVGQSLKEIDDLIDTALSNLSPISFSARSRGFNPLELSLANLNDTVKSTREILENSKNSLKQTRSARTQSVNLEKEIKELHQQVNLSGQEIQKRRDFIAEHFQAVESLVTDLESFQQRATEIDTHSKSFLSKFQEFDAEIDNRKQLNEITIDALNNTKNELDKTLIEAKEITETASKSLNISVAYALATSFGDSEESIQKTIIFTGLMFSLSILFLVALVFIAVDPRIIPGISSDFARNALTSPSNDDLDIISAVADSLNLNDTMTTISNLGIRFLIVLPGIILVRVAARTFESQIIAKRQYKFKKTIATALPEFQNQVSRERDDEFRRRVTLLAFEALSENPDERINTKNRGRKSKKNMRNWIEDAIRRE